jgi:hypothetical protein
VDSTVTSFDEDENSVFETTAVEVDQNEDGQSETDVIFYDTDQDGQADSIEMVSMVDTDNDGIVDTIVTSIDSDADGNFDSTEMSPAVGTALADIAENEDGYRGEDGVWYRPTFEADEVENMDDIVGDPEGDMENWHLQQHDDTCAVVSQEFILEELLTGSSTKRNFGSWRSRMGGMKMAEHRCMPWAKFSNITGGGGTEPGCHHIGH